MSSLSTPVAMSPSEGWRRLVAIFGLVCTLSAVLTLSYHNLSALTSWWAQPEGSHGWVIPIITAFILWQRWPAVRATADGASWSGVAVVAAGVLLMLIDTVGQLQRVALPAVVVVTFGGVVAAWGWRAARYTAVPLGFLLFAMPPPGPLYVEVSLQLQLLSSEIGTAMLRLLGISVFLDGNVIDLGTYKLQVAEACSGLRYLFPLTALTFLCAWMYQAPLWAKAVVLFSVVPITILTNSARIAFTGVLVEYGSIAQAQGFMHFFEGWVIFLVALVLVFLLMVALARLRGDRAGFGGLLDVDRLSGAHIAFAEPQATKSKTSHRLLGLSLPWVLSVALVIAAVPVHEALMNRPQTIPDRPGLATFPLEVGAWRGQPSSVDARTQDILDSSDYFLGDFVRANTGGVVNLWVAYYDEQVKQAALHTPQQCLPGAGWEFVSLEAVDAPVVGHSEQPFSVNRALVTNGRQTMLVYYWLEARGGQFANPQLFKFANVRDSILQRRSDGALVRMITPLEPGESEAVAEARLVDFMRAAYPALEPHVGR
ncbi:MAG: VPLPA-CTERM-specific exosortase XrtD [Planctomycetes bacterium]|jgi:exosortase D (VPLPA-CTERM-specific)|nr:VPLPA-CTERM-specific exosortase XrtD [Planctomycetota bacterium]